jgi:hypothetical protein
MAQVASNIVVPVGSGNAITIFEAGTDGPPARSVVFERADSSAGTQNIYIVIDGFSDDREYVLFGTLMSDIVFGGEGQSGERGSIRSISIYADGPGELIDFAVTSV